MKLYPYQQDAARWLYSRYRAALWSGVGSGKTSVLLHMAYRRLCRLYVRSVLVIAPLAVAKNVWELQAQEWPELANLTFSKILGTPKQRLAAMRRNVDIYVVNYEVLHWLVQNWPEDWPVDMVILDESPRIGVHNSVRFNGTKTHKKENDDGTYTKIPPTPGLRHIIGKIPYVYLLSGTPLPNGYPKIWSQIYLLDQGARLGKNITAFRRKFMYQYGRESYQWRMETGAEEEIKKRLQDLCYTVPDSVVARYLPKLSVQDIWVTLPRKVRCIYDAMEGDFFAEVNGTEITAVNAGAKSSKLHQIVQGAVYDENKKIIPVHDEKLDVLDDLVASLEGYNVLIVYEFKHDLERLLAWQKAPVLNNKLSEKKFNKLVAEWNAKKHPKMYVHPQSVGHGLNIQFGGHHIIMFGLTWDLEYYIQIIGRLCRNKQAATTVFLHRILARDTIDVLIREVLRGKEITQDGFKRAFLKYKKKRTLAA